MRKDDYASFLACVPKKTRYQGAKRASGNEVCRRRVVVDDVRRDNPEAGVVSVTRRDGWRVFFAENTLWQCLFGILFWTEPFESDQLHSDFDWMPQCLKDRSFRRVFSREIDEKLAAVRNGNSLNLILRAIAANWGKPNGIFAWDRVDVEAIRTLLSANPSDASLCVMPVRQHSS